MGIKTKRIYEPPEPGDGFRLLTMRYWPRGIRKELVDGWERGLAPSRELLADIRSGAIDWAEFEQRYEHEMATREDSVEAMAELRERAWRETVTVICGCADEARCHRTVLRRLVEEA